ncbi:MAG: TonB-dependent receptor [Blastocatellales bacterium]
MKRLNVVLCSLFLVFAVAQFASAQTNVGSLRGAVVDARGSTVAGARVVLLLANRLSVAETRTNARGEFAFIRLPEGGYTLVVEADGLTQSGGAQPVRIEGGRDFQIVIPLTVAAIEDAVVVSATRTETMLGDTPNSAFVASGSDLLRLQRLTVLDALRTSPGVTVMQTARRGGVTSIFVRGGESDYTKVLIDGIPVNDAGGAFDLADLTTDNASRIELVRGAQSAIYGSDAVSGVLQLFTHRGATTVPEFDYSAEGGSFGFNRQFIRLSGADGAWDYSTSFTHLETNGRDRNDDYQNRIASANIGYRMDARQQMRLTVRNENSGTGVPGATAIFFPDPDDRIERRRLAVGLRYDNQLSQNWQQSLTLAFSQNRQHSFDPLAQDLTLPGTPVDSGFAFNDFTSSFVNSQRRRGIRYQNNIVTAGGHFITSGIDYEEERAVFDNGFLGESRVAAERKNTGFFIQDQFSLTPRILLVAGLRVENNRANLPDGFNDALDDLGSPRIGGTTGFGTLIAPKLAAVIVLRRSGIQSRRGMTRLKINYGEGIKAPTLIEAFSPSPFFLGNPELKPERSRNFDFVIEQFFLKDRIRVEGVYFDNRFRNQIAFVAEPSTFGGPITLPDGRLTHFINNDRSRARGMELSISWHPKRWLLFDGSYTLLDTRLVEAADIIDYSSLTLIPNPEVGLPLLRRPRNSGSFSATWMGNRFDINLVGTFMGRRRDGDPATFSRFDANGNPIYNRGYARIDLTGAYRLTSFMGLFARVENLLNRNYQEVLGYPAYRLNFSAGLRIRFGGGR